MAYNIAADKTSSNKLGNNCVNFENVSASQSFGARILIGAGNEISSHRLYIRILCLHLDLPC
jgi:hypothetical protein